MTASACPGGADMKPDASLSPVRSLWVGLLAILFSTLLAAAEPASLRITQVLTHGTDLTAYVAVRDESGGVVSGDSLMQAKATLGPHIAEIVSAQPFAASGEGVLYLFLVDISRSLDNTQFDRLRQALKDWVAAMGEKDRAAILAFGERVNTLVAPTADKAALNTAIAGLGPKDNRTALHQALAQGLTLGQQTGGDLPSRRAMVILSDGLDDAPGSMTAEEVEQRFGEAAVPIYAIGFSKGRDRTAREAGLATLGRFARRSGGLFVDASAGDPGTAYAEMRERIRAVDRLQIKCADCIADGNRYRLQIALPHAGRTLTDGVDLRLYPALLATTAPVAPATTSAAEAPSAQSPAAESSPAPAADANPSAPADAAPSPAVDATQPPTASATPSSPAAASPPHAGDATPPATTAEGVPAGSSPPAAGFSAFFKAWWPWLVGGGAV
ncbi:MAG: VWA domain-containing protein, partial [Gammaproteobacteria bacterium]|nr:VWA domain-containing protein [Gammaproteobacteria bacterium]